MNATMVISTKSGFEYSPPQRVEAGTAFLDPQRRKAGPLLVVRCRGERELMESRGQLGLGARQRDAGAQAAHHIDPIKMRIDEHCVVFVAIIPGERGPVR